MMSDEGDKADFDPYHKWLGISPDEQPPNHYRLLGINCFESDPEVVRNAADRTMSHLKTFATGPHAQHSQKLLNEVATASVCLLKPQKKRAYDEQLSEREGKPPDATTQVTTWVGDEPSSAADTTEDEALQAIAEKVGTESLSLSISNRRRGGTRRPRSPMRRQWIAASAAIVLFLGVIFLLRSEPLNRLTPSGNNGNGPIPPENGPTDAGKRDLLALFEDGDKLETASDGKSFLPVINNGESHTSIRIPFDPPEEYDLELQVIRHRVGDHDGLGLGITFVTPGNRFGDVYLDGYFGSGLEGLDGIHYKHSPTNFKGSLFDCNVTSKVVCKVRRTGIAVEVDGEPIIDWDGDFNRFRPMARSDPKLSVRSWKAHFDITHFTLVPFTNTVRTDEGGPPGPGPWTAQDVRAGLEATYFDGTVLAPEGFKTTLIVANVDWHSEGPPVDLNGEPVEGVGVDNFSIVYRGFLQVPKAGNYTLYVASDDGVRVYLDGELLIDRWHLQMPHLGEGKQVELTEGLQPLRIEYFEWTGGAHLEMRWKNESEVKPIIIPASAYFHDPKAPFDIQSHKKVAPQAMKTRTSLSEALDDPTTVYILDLSHSGLVELPQQVHTLRRLVEVDLQGNQLSSLPSEVEFWGSELRRVDLSDNSLTFLPAEVRTWGRLEQFDVSNNQITTLPKEVSHWGKVAVLDFSGNRVSSLPAEVAHWGGLIQLDLNDNQLTMLPPEVGAWVYLEQIDLSGNQLKTLPNEIGEWKQLKRLDLRGNVLAAGELEKIRRVLPSAEIQFVYEDVVIRQAVGRALQWLIRHQLTDGGWNFNHSVTCQDCGDPGKLEQARHGATAMALLAFLGAGHNQKSGPYSKQIRDGFEFLCNTMPGKDSFDKPGGGMYSHALATIAICEAFAQTRYRNLREPAKAAIEFIQTAQDPKGGGWRYKPGQAGDISVTGWQLTALKSGESTGIKDLRIPQIHFWRATTFLDGVQLDDGAFYGYQQPNKAPHTTAVGLACRIKLGWKRDNPALQRGVNFLSSAGPSNVNLYQNFYANQVLHDYGGPLWENWNQQMLNMLFDTQSTGGHADGSWFMDHPLCTGPGGRLYCTVMAALILETEMGHLSFHRHNSIEPDGQP